MDARLREEIERYLRTGEHDNHETYSRIVEVRRSPAERRALLADADLPHPPDEQVDREEYLDILREAVSARNGWKRILARCAPPRRTRLAPLP